MKGSAIEFSCPHCMEINKMWFEHDKHINIEQERECVHCQKPFIVTIAHGLHGKFNAIVTSMPDTTLSEG